MQDADYIPDASVTDKSRGKRKEGNGAGGTLPSNAGDINITVHFPVARIKRIMQADDDVGKVAQVTPVVVCEYYTVFLVVDHVLVGIAPRRRVPLLSTFNC